MFDKRIATWTLRVFAVSTALFLAKPLFAFGGEYIGACYYRGNKGIEIRYIGGYPRSKRVNISVRDADPSSFRLIADGKSKECGIAPLYGADRRRVFFRQHVIEKADPDSFQAFDGGYATDKNAVYYREKIVPGISPEKFRPVAIPYGSAYFGLSRSAALFRGEPIKAQVDPDTFVALGGRWIKDARHVYLSNHPLPIKGADPASFKVLPYRKGRRMNVPLARDKNGVYIIKSEGAVPLPDADPATFRLINKNYSRDDKHVYYKGRKVEGADAKSFHIPHPVNSHSGRDAFRKYHLGKPVGKQIKSRQE